MKKISTMVFTVIAVLSLSACSLNVEFFNRLKNNETDENNQGMAEYVDNGPIANTISVGMYDFDTFNPLMTKSQTVKEALQYIYEPLFYLNEQLQAEPVLAKDYGMSADGKTIIINLRDDVQWHNGYAFNANDVAYTISQIKSGITEYTDALAYVQSWSIIDDYQISVTFDHPISLPASIFNFPIILNRTDMSITNNPIGTGPFSMSGKISTDRYMLVGFDGYHEGKPKLNGVYIDEAPNIELYEAMYSTGAFDLATSDTLDMKSYTPKGSVVINDYTSNQLLFLGINHEKTELSGVNTRIALSQLVNKEQIVSSILYSRAVKTDVPINPSFWLYDGKVSQSDGLSAEGHIRIDAWTDLDNGGYMRNINNTTQYLSVELLVNNDSDEDKEIAKLIANDFNKYGVKTTINAVPYEAYMQKINSKYYDMFIGNFNLPNTQDQAMMLGGGNIFNYNNEDINAVLTQIGTTSDIEQLKGLYGQFAEIFTADIPFIPIAYTKKSIMVSPTLNNVSIPGINSYYRNSHLWSIK